MLCSFLIVVLGTVMGAALALAGSATWPTLFASSLIMSIGGGLLGGFVYVWTPELFPTRMRAWATSASSAWNRIGSIISPILVGYILAANIGIAPIFIMFGIVSLVGLIVTWTLGIETKGRVLETLSA